VRFAGIDINHLLHPQRLIDLEAELRVLPTFQWRSFTKLNGMKILADIQPIEGWDQKDSGADVRDNCGCIPGVDGRNPNMTPVPCPQFMGSKHGHSPDNHSGSVAGNEFISGKLDRCLASGQRRPFFLSRWTSATSLRGIHVLVVVSQQGAPIR
jgi:hypothetical protein